MVGMYNVQKILKITCFVMAIITKNNLVYTTKMYRP